MIKSIASSSSSNVLHSLRANPVSFSFFSSKINPFCGMNAKCKLSNHAITSGFGRASIQHKTMVSGRDSIGFQSRASSRNFSSSSSSQKEAISEKNKKIAMYMLSVCIATVGMSYASVPLYKMFCAATGFGGTPQNTSMEKASQVLPVVTAKPIRVTFAATTTDNLAWKFKPQQKEIKVLPGETALAFYTAKNNSDRPVTGVATYNITPVKAGNYFHKIQCFCFDEQRLRPHEEVDMPVFFFISPEIVDDPNMRDVETITLSYMFFKVKGTEDEEDEIEEKKDEKK